MKSAIITGANGFIGRNLVKELIENNYLIYALVRNKDNICNELKNDNVIIIKCPMEEYKNINKIVKNDCDIAYHFAWEGSNGEKRKDYYTQINNIKFSCDLAENVCAQKIVYAGSIMEYEFINLLLNRMDTQLSNIYNVAKMSARNMMHIIADTRRIDYLPLTISNIYGEGEESERFLINLLKKMIKKEHISLTACEQLYDFIYIKDAVKAIRYVGEKGTCNKNYYIGNSETKILKEFILEIKNQLEECDLGFGEIEYNGSYDNYKNIDTGLLKKEFGFIPEVSFSEGIKKTIKWMEDIKNVKNHF